MIVDHNTHTFDNCPTCRGMVLVLRSGDQGLTKAARAKINAAQIKLMRSYMKQEGIAA